MKIQKRKSPLAGLFKVQKHASSVSPDAANATWLDSVNETKKLGFKKRSFRLFTTLMLFAKTGESKTEETASLDSPPTRQDQIQRKMYALKEKKGSQAYPWWFDTQNNPKRSRWLQSTLSELDEKTLAMLKLVEEDADSFAQRAEMYYKKRPELISFIGDFYRSHRSLAERVDMLKSEPRSRLMTPMSSPVSTKCQFNKLIATMEKSYDSYSETYSEAGESEVDDPEQDEETQVDREADSGESEVDDPEEDEETLVDREMSNEPKASETEYPKQENAQIDRAVYMVNQSDVSEVKKLRDEIERLKEESRIQKEQLMQKDEEKREVIRQLSLSLDILKENVSECKRSTAKEPSKKWGPFEFNKGRGIFSVKFFGGPSKSPVNQEMKRFGI